jgi:hypothetical protein
MSRKASGDPDDSSSEISSSDEEKNNRKSTNSNSEDGHSDSSSSSDDEIQFVPTRFRNLNNVKIRISELRDILSYKTYRLRNQSQKFTTKMQNNSVVLH